jgi:signal transduction histidine kinase
LLVAALAYKALEADRSHRAAAVRTLHDYAEFATWEYAVRAQRSVLTGVVPMFAYTMSRINPDLPSDSLPSADEFAQMARRGGSYCKCLEGAHFFFRYNWRTGEFVTAGAPAAPAVLRWVRDTVTAHTRIFTAPAGFAPLAYGGTQSGGGLRRLSVLITNDAYVILFDRVAGQDRAVVYALVRDLDNQPVATYGFETDATAFAGPLFGAAFKREDLLPSSLLHGVPDDAVVLAVQVTDLAGHRLYHSAERFPTVYAALDTLDATFGRVVVRASLLPEFAGRLVVGGLPRSQLPLLVGLVLLTATLLAGALRQMRRQQELARLRTNFVSGVSHELRTPLTQIRLFAELLRNRALRSEDERDHALRVVDQEARRLTYLVENVLDFSRGERRLNRIVRERINVAAAVRDALKFFSPIAQARRVTLRQNVPPRFIATVDAAALRQILLNLLDNAVKYGPLGQTVTVTVSDIDGTLRLYVDDQGPGIPAAERDRVWEPYHRLAREIHSAVGGTGIGLAVVRELAELHGGCTWVESVPHSPGEPSGARFIVDLATAAEPVGKGPFKTGEWSQEQLAVEGEDRDATDPRDVPDRRMVPDQGGTPADDTTAGPAGRDTGANSTRKGS